MNSLSDVLVREGATLRETLECITKSGKQLALVVDAGGRLLGLATDGDLRKAILRGVSLDAPVDQAMNRSPQVAAPGLAPGAALALMRRRAIRQLPVVDADLLSGRDVRHVLGEQLRGQSPKFEALTP